MSEERRRRQADRLVRRFTVGIGPKHSGQHLKILAANDLTRAWAERNKQVLTIAIRELHLEIEGHRLSHLTSLGFAMPVHLETPATIARRFEAIVQRGFPEESFDVRVEPLAVGAES